MPCRAARRAVPTRRAIAWRPGAVTVVPGALGFADAVGAESIAPIAHEVLPSLAA